MIKYTIITMLFNDYDLLREPSEIDENAEYICLTDNKELKSNIWKIFYLPSLDTQKLTGFQKTYIIKYTKLLNYISNESKYVIRVDASILIHKKLTPIIEYLENNNYDALLMIHTHRNDFLEEYKIWTNYRQLDKQYFEKFIRYMSKEHFDINQTGLIECTIQIFKINDITADLLLETGTLLYNETKYNDLDQCWFTYMLSKYIDKLNICFTNILILTSDYMQLCKHKDIIPATIKQNNFIKRENKVFDITKIYTEKLFGLQHILKFF